MKKSSIYLFIFLSVLQLSSEVYAGVCGLSVAASNLVINWDMTWTQQSISITVSKTNPAACTFGLGFSKGISGSYTRYAEVTGKQINYQLYQDSGKTKILKDVPDATTVNDVIMVTLPPGSSPQVVQYFFDIPYSLATTPFLVASGVYIDNFIISAYEGLTPLGFILLADATAPVNLKVNVDPLVSISLVDTGGSFLTSTTTKSIDFGNLFQSQTSRFDMLLRTNAGLSVTMTSLNASRMKHLTKNSYVPYTISVNGAAADLTGVAPVLTASGQTSMMGLGYPVKIVVGAVGAAAIAGGYQDTVTITAITTE